MSSSLPWSCAAWCAEPASTRYAVTGQAAGMALPRYAGLPAWRLVGQPSLTGELAVSDPVRPSGLSAEPVQLVVLVALEVALEPEPPSRIVVGTLPSQDVGGHPVEEPSV